MLKTVLRTKFLHGRGRMHYYNFCKIIIVAQALRQIKMLIGKMEQKDRASIPA